MLLEIFKKITNRLFQNRDIVTGGIVSVIISILISLFLCYLYRFTFICFDPELCERIKEPMIQISP